VNTRAVTPTRSPGSAVTPDPARICVRRLAAQQMPDRQALHDATPERDVRTASPSLRRQRQVLSVPMNMLWPTCRTAACATTGIPATTASPAPPAPATGTPSAPEVVLAGACGRLHHQHLRRRLGPLHRRHPEERRQALPLASGSRLGILRQTQQRTDRPVAGEPASTDRSIMQPTPAASPVRQKPVELDRQQPLQRGVPVTPWD
jgi:hypothetical protein